MTPERRLVGRPRVGDGGEEWREGVGGELPRYGVELGGGHGLRVAVRQLHHAAVDTLPHPLLIAATLLLLQSFGSHSRTSVAAGVVCSR